VCEVDVKEILLAVVFFVAVTAVLTLYSRRRLAGRWKGKVENVRSFSRLDHNSSEDLVKRYVETVEIIFRTEGGRKTKVKMERSAYTKAYPGGLAAGDSVEKHEGDWYPRKVDA